jgi:hypothetical protein
MTIKTISYSESRESAVGYLKQWKKFGAEAELSERESPEEAMQSLAALVAKMHNDMVPRVDPEFAMSSGMQMSNGDSFYVPPSTMTDGKLYSAKPDPKQDAKSRIIDSIMGCSNMVVLETFRKLAKREGGVVQEAFDEREKQLQK